VKAPRLSWKQGGKAALGLAQDPPVGCGPNEVYEFLVLSGIQFYPTSTTTLQESQAHLALSGGSLFWSDASPTRINRASFEARTVAPLAIAMDKVDNFVIHESSIYWVEARDGTAPSGCHGPSMIRPIYRSALDGSETTLLWEGDNCKQATADLVVDDSNVYFVTSRTSPEDKYSILKVPVTGGAATTLVVAGPLGGGSGPRIEPVKM
jgi:hypothetical protein